MNGFNHLESDCSEFVEVDPTGRYGRYNEVLGKGASKTVYRAFDEYEGIEVAWNQVKLHDFLQSPDDLERLYCEIHLLKTLKHRNIMKFYTSWVDTSKRNINFVTEMFTSGTLRQYRLKHRRVNIRAVKHWCRQILKGLLYLHSHDPPVIHRDLKCDNIFVNGNQGEVKIGDLGLAAILRKSHAAHCVEFMAPEVYEEQYNELVDIYSFGMCILEMVTFEYPYSECTHPAQIYKKVTSGKRPDALYKVKDPEVIKFIEKCLATVSSRLSARELLKDPFLQIDDYDCDFGSHDYQREVDDISSLTRQPFLDPRTGSGSLLGGYCNGNDFEPCDEWGSYRAEIDASGIDLFEHHDDDDHASNVDITIKGKMKNDGSIFLRLRITDKEGRIRNIYFPFDIDLDTALSVATEMVAELDITDQDVTHIANMIDGEISRLVPGWKPGPGMEETTRFSNSKLCQNCASNHTSIGSFIDFLSNNHASHNTPFFQCCNGCGSIHGRFEEFTYQVDGSENHVPVNDGSIPSINNPDGILDHHQHHHHREPWDQQESVEFSSHGSGTSHSDEETENSLRIILVKCENSGGENRDKLSVKHLSNCRSFSMLHSLDGDVLDDYEKDLQWKQRWIRAKYLLEVREIRNKQLESPFKFTTSPTMNAVEENKGDGELMLLKSDSELSSSNLCYSTQSSSCPSLGTQRDLNCEATRDVPRNSPRTNNDTTASNDNKKSLISSSLLPSTLHRTISLPVDAVHIQ